MGDSNDNILVDSDDDEDDQPVLKSPNKKRKRARILEEEEDDDEEDDNGNDAAEAVVAAAEPKKKKLKKKKLKKKKHDDDDSDNDDDDFASISKKKKKKPPPSSDDGDNQKDDDDGHTTKPKFMDALELVENQIWPFLTVDDFYCLGYTSLDMKDYVRKYAKRQGEKNENDNHKKWLCKDCGCNVFSVTRRIYRKKKDIPKDGKHKKVITLMPPYSCNCKCGGEEDDDPNCRWLCYDCSNEYTCAVCDEESIDNYCSECLFQHHECRRCKNKVCSKCYEDFATCRPDYCGCRYCDDCEYRNCECEP